MGWRRVCWSPCYFAPVLSMRLLIKQLHPVRSKRPEYVSDEHTIDIQQLGMRASINSGTNSRQSRVDANTFLTHEEAEELDFLKRTIGFAGSIFEESLTRIHVENAEDGDNFRGNRRRRRMRARVGLVSRILNQSCTLHRTSYIMRNAAEPINRSKSPRPPGASLS